MGNNDKVSHDLIPIPDAKIAELALAFAEIAKDDCRAARVLRRERLFAHAMYMLQQSVEKSVKSLGLMLGIFTSSDLRMISHRSVYALLITVDSFAEQLAKSAAFLQASKQPEVEDLRALGFKQVFDNLVSAVPSPAMLKLDKERIDKLDQERMWHATLDLDTNDELVKSALAHLEKIPWDTQRILLPLKTIVKLSKLMNKGGLESEYFFSIMRASPRAYSLSMLTMWHEIPSRYPPTSKNDYWLPKQYSPDKPLIRRLPFFLKHAKILADAVSTEASAACKLAYSNKKRLNHHLHENHANRDPL